MKIYFVSLGCDKNLVDSEHMLADLANNGYEICDNESLADIIIVNTCCFIHDAMEESINTILEMASYKVNGNCKCLVVSGCLGERYSGDIHVEMPEVDVVVGTNSYDKIISAIDEFFSTGAFTICKRNLENTITHTSGRFKSVYSSYEYLKIAEGCNKHCTYCVIPSIRGPYRSFLMDDLINEAKSLVEMGTKEIILVAQETTVYGMDFDGKKHLGGLLDELNKIDGLKSIRLMYCYPEEIDDDLIEAILRNDKVAHYIDMPIQHCNDDILKRMGRRTNKSDIITVINKLRNRIPDICIRTTLICGFPGETDTVHEELVEFVQDMKFDRLGVFPYSQEENTPAASFDNQISEDVKVSRANRIMEVQQDISFDLNKNLIGNTLNVMIEGEIPEDNVYVGRTYRDAPDIDGYIFIDNTKPLNTGDVVSVRVNKAMEYDLIGECI